MRTAVVARPPAFGSTLVKFDASEALKVPGVEQVVKTANGVAVVAAHFWAAKVGRDALVIEWSKPAGGGVNTLALLDQFKQLAKKPGATVVDTGKIDGALAAAKSRIEAEYDVPYLAHATMEPMNCVAKSTATRSRSGPARSFRRWIR